MVCFTKILGDILFEISLLIAKRKSRENNIKTNFKVVLIVYRKQII